MKKLLLLFSIVIFYIGCKKDESLSSIDYQINEYSEGILGHWKLDQTKVDSNITRYLIDPVFGSTTSEIIFNWDTTINYPILMQPDSPSLCDIYYTYQYDNLYEMRGYYINEDSGDEGWFLDGLFFGPHNYSINAEFLNHSDFFGDITSLQITSMSETRMRLLNENRDSISISSNEYQIISTNITTNLLRVEELPIQVE
tara:strand:- start:1241 stop:1837 length:597 start_codon:yes stop_codon:yes gene_type:complete